MAFAYTNSKGQTYYLHGREVELNNDQTRTIYFFAKDRREGVLDSVPSGWQVMEGRNALPVLSKEDSQRRSSGSSGSKRSSSGNGGGRSKSNSGGNSGSRSGGNSGSRSSGSNSGRSGGSSRGRSNN